MMGDMNCGRSGLTTVLTIYKVGLRGNSASKSTRKHHFRTKKPRKNVKITQKIGIGFFGSTMPQVQILSLRPKKSYYFDTTFFIQTAGLAYHHASACISSALWAVYHHSSECIFLRFDDIQCSALMIYRNELRMIYTFCESD